MLYLEFNKIQYLDGNKKCVNLTFNKFIGLQNLGNNCHIYNNKNSIIFNNWI